MANNRDVRGTTFGISPIPNVACGTLQPQYNSARIAAQEDGEGVDVLKVAIGSVDDFFK